MIQAPQLRKASLPHNEDIRISALESFGILDTPAEKEFNNLAELLGQITHCRGAAISFMDRDRQWFKAQSGLAGNQLPRDHSFCSYTILEGKSLVIPDTAIDKRFRDLPGPTLLPATDLSGQSGHPAYSNHPDRPSDSNQPGELHHSGIPGTSPRSTRSDHPAYSNHPDRLSNSNQPGEPHRSGITRTSAHSAQSEQTDRSGVPTTPVYSAQSGQPGPPAHPEAAPAHFPQPIQPDLPAVPEHPDHALRSSGIRFYAGSPILTTRGLSIGTVCVFDPAPRVFEPGEQLSLERSLEIIAGQVARLLELRVRNSLVLKKTEELIDIERRTVQHTIQEHEKERQEIGITLHENFAQTCAACLLYLNIALEDGKPNLPIVRKVKEELSSLVQDMRKVSKIFSPGAMPFLNVKNMVTDFLLHTKDTLPYAITFDWQGDSQLISADGSLNLFRIIVQYLQILQDRTDTRHVSILIRVDTDIELLITDDGTPSEKDGAAQEIAFNMILNRVEMGKGSYHLEEVQPVQTVQAPHAAHAVHTADTFQSARAVETIDPSPGMRLYIRLPFL